MIQPHNHHYLSNSARAQTPEAYMNTSNGVDMAQIKESLGSGPEAWGKMGFFLPLLPLLLISLSIADPHFTLAWGRDGHLMICKIAEQYLTENATQAVRNLLGAGGLAKECYWAGEDHVKNQYLWAKRLHYANTQNVPYFDYSTDCWNDACVAGAIIEYTCHLLNNYRRALPPPGHSLDVSLKFLAHFMGDVHQPLHVGFARDRGGNCIPVRWPRGCYMRTNLHEVWDAAIITTALSLDYADDPNNMTDSIVENYITGKVIRIREPEDYASESIALACDYAYQDENNRTVEQDSTLTDEYFRSRLPFVEQRIAEAGWRLADLLNKIFVRGIESN